MIYQSRSKITKLCTLLDHGVRSHDLPGSKTCPCHKQEELHSWTHHWAFKKTSLLKHVWQATHAARRHPHEFVAVYKNQVWLQGVAHEMKSGAWAAATHLHGCSMLQSQSDKPPDGHKPPLPPRSAEKTHVSPTGCSFRTFTVVPEEEMNYFTVRIIVA